jgi:hypothetical protein
MANVSRLTVAVALLASLAACQRNGKQLAATPDTHTSAATLVGRAPKPSPPAATTNLPCPPTVGHGEIRPFDGGPFGQSQYFTTTTSFRASDGYPYQVYAGANADDSRQGELVIWRMTKDACNGGDYDGVRKLLRDVHMGGRDTLIAVSGDEVTVRASDGHEHIINVVKQGPDAR